MRSLTSLLTWLVLSVLGTAFSACQTTNTTVMDYRDATYGGEVYKASDRTSVLFLIDGLSSETLRTALREQTIPVIADAFSLTEKGRFSYGRAVFPSLTFPNIASILTGVSVSEQPIIGNHLVLDGKIIDLENVSNWQQLNVALQRRTIFYQLADQSQSSVSFSYAFSGGATAYQQTSITAAASYLQNDFAAIDTQTIDSLKALLTDTQPAKWPRFIFVHLIGVDATSHLAGPLDPSVQTYLHTLDAQLAPIFWILNHPNGTAAATRQVNYALTADHGFRTTPDFSPLEQVVEHMNRNLRVISDNRIATLSSNDSHASSSDTERITLAKALLQVPHVGWAAVKTETGVDLLKRSGEQARITIAKAKCPSGPPLAAHFEWLGQSAPAGFSCLSDFDLATSADDDSYIVPSLVDYFQSPNAPEMVFIADDHSSFVQGYKGNHGGLSREEMLVPVLTKDVDAIRGVHPIYELIRTMGVTP